ncbi:MAG: fimbrillin family protein [Bacteroidales bacterium]|nr:fimbrillin family protein [Bacteroidales bacterium]
MKRFFFSLIALSAAVIGCTKSELLDTPGLQSAEVSFSPYTGRTPMTKATAIVQASGLAADGGFYVYGYLNQTAGTTTNTSVYLENKHVTSADGSNWSYGNKVVYWPEASSKSTLSFVAYSANAWGADHEPDAANESAKDDNIVWVDGKVGEEFIFTVPDAMNNQVDLLATAMQENLSLNSSNDKVSSTGQVKLNFHHLLSRVGFKVQTSTSKPVTITGITLKGNMLSQGTLNLVNGAKGEAIPALTPTGTKAVKEYSYLTEATTISGANTEAKPIYGTTPKYLMLLPHSALAADDGLGSDHSIVVSYKVGDSNYENHVSSRLETGFEFAPGKAYEFILKLSTSALSFEVEEEPWNTTDGDKEVGPLEPEEGGSEDSGESGDEPVIDEEATSATINSTANNKDVNMTFSLNSVETTAAILTIDVHTEYNDGGKILGMGYNSLVGILYAPINSNWANANVKYYESEKIAVDQYAIRIEGLNPETEYKYCLRVARKGTISGNIDHKKDFYDPTLTFTTPSNFTDITLDITSPKQERYQLEDGTTLTKATLSHIAIPAQLNGTPLPISEYGFCWMSGNGTPSKLNDYVSNKTTTKVSGDLANGFSYTLEKLRQNASYTYCAYVVVSEDVYAYIIPSGKISAERTLIYPANTILYSAPFSFMTQPIVGEDDDTGSGWGSNGETDILSNTTEQENNNNN